MQLPTRTSFLTSSQREGYERGRVKGAEARTQYLSRCPWLHGEHRLGPHVWERRLTHATGCMWRSEDHTGCLSSPFTVFEGGSSCLPLSIPGWLACQHPESLLSLHHMAVGVLELPRQCLALTQAMGIQTQVLILVQQAYYHWVISPS